MRSITFAALGAVLLCACGDDDNSDDDGVANDASVDASTRDAGSLDGGGMDASRPDASADAGSGRAQASLASKSNSTVTGNAIFAYVNGVATLEVAVSGASPGEHGIHIHQTGDCSAADASSAGGHWNPDMHNHGSGAPDASASSHLGDLGNIVVAADGKGTLTISKAEWTIGTGATTDVVGHAIVVHAYEDDLVTQNGDAGPGNSGGRQACGVITEL